MMQIVTADWETYYDKDYSLSKLTTEEYVRDDRFEAIMLGLRWPDGSTQVITGTHPEIQYQLDAIDWDQYAVLCHNTMFDAAIFTWHFNVKPAAWLDTLSMARAMFGLKGNSLAALAKKYNLEDKGTEVLNALGKRRVDFSEQQFSDYARYCLHDVHLCFRLFELMSQGWYDLDSFDKRDPYPVQELKIIDRVIRMYTEPALRLNKEKLEEHLEGVLARKERLLVDSGIAKEDLMSNPKFAAVLESFGVAPPMKISPTNGKLTYAFAKTDTAMKELLEHSDERVQAVVAARMGVKSTLEETRTQRFISIASRGKTLPIPLKYSAARTHRLGGMDSINLQNLPSRGKDAGRIKSCIEAPPGYVVINSDSSNIEARMLAWLAEQDDLVTDFANGVDVYCKMASRIYGREITKANKQERFVGKTVVLGCGYQTGAMKLQQTLKTADPPMLLNEDESKRVIDIYRTSVPKIVNLWAQGEAAINAMYKGQTCKFGRDDVLIVDGKRGIKLPSGLYLSYPQLHRAVNDKGREVWRYKDERGLVDIYGGKLVENVTQALARIIVMNQLMRITKKLKVVLTVHDSVVVLAREAEAKQAQAFVEECMRWIPKWATGCPINCESEYGLTYGDC